jgi:acyl-CoA hydrolase
VLTVSSDRIDFKKPIPAGTIVELIGKVSKIGNTSLDVKVKFISSKCTAIIERRPYLNFTFVALDENKKPIRILDNNETA